MTNYIDFIAEQIIGYLGNFADRDDLDYPLYRIYALLVLAKGTETTPEDVHDAWSVWCLGIDMDHRSLVPFSERTTSVQDLDNEYVDAIHAVAEYRSKQLSEQVR